MRCTKFTEASNKSTSPEDRSKNGRRSQADERGTGEKGEQFSICRSFILKVDYYYDYVAVLF